MSFRILYSISRPWKRRVPAFYGPTNRLAGFLDQNFWSSAIGAEFPSLGNGRRVILGRYADLKVHIAPQKTHLRRPMLWLELSLVSCYSFCGSYGGYSRYRHIGRKKGNNRYSGDYVL